jgi:methylthioxylose transferase
VVALVLAVLAMLVPAVTGWNVRVNSFPPLHAEWDPRVGPGTIPAVVLGVLAVLYAVDVSERLGWERLLLVVFVVGLAWMLALAFVDGSSGISHILETPYEYLRTAHRTTDLHRTLQDYVSRIPYEAAPRNWPVHIAGHPAGALVFFVVLVRLGLGSGFAAGLVVTMLAATTAVAVMVTVRALGGERLARRAAPFLVFGPAAIWQAVSADAMFAAVGAWGIAALALGATRRRVGWSLLAGLLLGYAVMLSYGLPLLAILALAVLYLSRSWLALPLASVAALAVVLVFALFGFAYWEALPAIHERYWEGVGGRRPPSYWMWGDLAALVFSAGPMAGAGMGQLLSKGRKLFDDASTRVVVVLAGAGAAMVLAADLSQMSRGEVERIWLPFVPWLLLACALLPRRWRWGGLVLQVVSALVIQHLLDTGW